MNDVQQPTVISALEVQLYPLYWTSSHCSGIFKHLK